MSFITKNFLLQNETARQLYHTYAAGQPILDYHCHLSAKDIAENRRFRNLTEIWLEGDHYKWRAMRANGIDEKYCTGDADPYEQFAAWARTVPCTLRNPLYHWTHLELLRYFGLDQLLDEGTAPQIWELANECLLTEELTAQGILTKFRVAAICTTDDPTDLLEYHEQIASSEFATRVLPAFRPDRALRTDDPASFNEWTDKLGACANVDTACFSGFLDALLSRHDYFHQHGCRISDHGLDYCYARSCTDREAQRIYNQVRSGKDLTSNESETFASYLMLFFGQLDAEKNWTKQLHLGALRNVNTQMRNNLGRDTGFDSIGEWPQVACLAAYLDKLDQMDRLPKMILFNANPANNYAFATLAGNFQRGVIPGKVQFGSGWWFLDQK